MSEIIIKKKAYIKEEELNSYSYVASREGKKYLVYDFGGDYEHFSDFKFAAKRLKNSGVTIPEVIAIDKKSQRIVIEALEGRTPFDLLQEADLDEKILELAFILNYKARVNGLRLDFHPWNFVYANKTLYYIPFTFTSYIRDEDFTQREIRLWFYTKEFADELIKRGIPMDKNRLLSEFEQNKKMVLMVVKYFR